MFLLNQHTGNNEPEGSFLHDFAEIEIKKMIGAETSQSTYGIKNHRRLFLALQISEEFLYLCTSYVIKSEL